MCDCCCCVQRMKPFFRSASEVENNLPQLVTVSEDFFLAVTELNHKFEATCGRTRLLIKYRPRSGVRSDSIGSWSRVRYFCTYPAIVRDREGTMTSSCDWLN